MAAENSTAAHDGIPKDDLSNRVYKAYCQGNKGIADVNDVQNMNGVKFTQNEICRNECFLFSVICGKIEKIVNEMISMQEDSFMSETVYPAHIRILEDGSGRIQTVAEHLHNTAEIAARSGKVYGLEQTGRLLGMVHDAGKLCGDFKDYIEKAARHEPVRRGSVKHSFAGVRLIMRYHGKNANCTVEDITLELLAYAVGAHHGLFDCVTEEGVNEFERRMHEDLPNCDESVECYYRQIMDEAALHALIQQATAELSMVLGCCRKLCKRPQQMKYLIGQLARLLLSLLIDADRQDTAAFMADDQFPEPYGTENWKELQSHADAMYQNMVEHAKATPVNGARKAIASECMANIRNSGRVIRLNLPTGAGKTITGLRAALALAVEQQKAHIIYTAPLLSILEQNAGEIRRYVGHDGAVLEHHSNIIETKDDDEDIRSSRDLLVQNWSAPVIVTTMVQLLNTMFDGATTSVRRYQALADSVVIIDEVQTIPRKMLTLFNMTLSFLSGVCQTTFILCSATQPYLEKAHTPPLVQLQDLMPYRKEIWEPFRRTRITPGDSLRLEELPAFIEQKMAEHRSLLVVCNKKAEAAYLLEAVTLPDTEIIHLSASMCTDHRRKTLKTIFSLLESQRKVLCISTQVIEAGVDVSFDCVIRLTAGMDSIVQAAGRCNRHGEHPGLCPVYVVHCVDEKLTHLRDIADGQQATLGLLDDYKCHPGRYDDRLESDEAIRLYYEKLYQNMSQNSQDMPILHDDQTVYQLLSDHEKAARQDRERQHYYMAQGFKTAGSAFEVFDSRGKSVIVPWGDGQQVIDALQTVYADNVAVVRKLLQQARPYAVTVYDYQFRQLDSAGGVMELLDGAAYALSPQYYDDRLGLTLPDNQFLEV